ncbi:MAG: hypothetical protein J0M34_08020 [Alphaproteobacteria bacterium]|nr:hypothetical protein [Alphaproteobacteria bacterium]
MSAIATAGDGFEKMVQLIRAATNLEHASHAVSRNTEIFQNLTTQSQRITKAILENDYQALQEIKSGKLFGDLRTSVSANAKGKDRENLLSALDALESQVAEALKLRVKSLDPLEVPDSLKPIAALLEKSEISALQLENFILRFEKATSLVGKNGVKPLDDLMALRKGLVQLKDRLSKDIKITKVEGATALVTKESAIAQIETVISTLDKDAARVITTQRSKFNQRLTAAKQPADLVALADDIRAYITKIEKAELEVPAELSTLLTTTTQKVRTLHEDAVAAAGAFRQTGKQESVLGTLLSFQKAKGQIIDAKQITDILSRTDLTAYINKVSKFRTDTTSQQVMNGVSGLLGVKKVLTELRAVAKSGARDVLDRHLKDVDVALEALTPKALAKLKEPVTISHARAELKLPEGPLSETIIRTKVNEMERSITGIVGRLKGAGASADVCSQYDAALRARVSDLSLAAHQQISSQSSVTKVADTLAPKKAHFAGVVSTIRGDGGEKVTKVIKSIEGSMKDLANKIRIAGGLSMVAQGKIAGTLSQITRHIDDMPDAMVRYATKRDLNPRKWQEHFHKLSDYADFAYGHDAKSGKGIVDLLDDVAATPSEKIAFAPLLRKVEAFYEQREMSPAAMPDPDTLEAMKTIAGRLNTQEKVLTSKMQDKFKSIQDGVAHVQELSKAKRYESIATSMDVAKLEDLGESLTRLNQHGIMKVDPKDLTSPMGAIKHLTDDVTKANVMVRDGVMPERLSKRVRGLAGAIADAPYQKRLAEEAARAAKSVDQGASV